MSRESRFGRACALACAMFLAAVGTAGAHDPTPQGNESWHSTKSSDYKWHSSMHDDLKPVLNNVLQTTWDDRTTNNSDSVVFEYDQGSSGEGLVYFQTTAAGFCGSGWLGCADSRYLPFWEIWIRSNPGPQGAGFEQWCDFEDDSGCPDVGRVAIHEAGHVGDLDHYNTTNWTKTRMHPVPPMKGEDSTYDSRTLGGCDEARLQLIYDVWSKGFQYSKCLDHVANAEIDVGLKTALTTSITSITVCANETVTVTGRLDIKNEATYGELKNNGLWTRTVQIDRGSTPNYTSAVVDSTTDDNWSKSFTHSNVTFNYVAHYDSPSNEGLADSPNRAFTITWLSPQIPCDP